MPEVTSRRHPPTEDFIELVDEVIRLRGRIATAQKSEVQLPEGLGNAHWTILTAVTRAATPPTVSQIARSFGHARQSVQRLADDLVEAGLIAQEDNPAHARVKLYVATQLGQSYFERSSRESREWARLVIAGMAPAALRTTVDTLREIRVRLEEQQRT